VHALVIDGSYANEFCEFDVHIEAVLPAGYFEDSD